MSPAAHAIHFLGILGVSTSVTAKIPPWKQIEADSGSPRGASLIFAKLTRLQIPLIASSQGIDTSDDNLAGRLQLGVLMAVAEFERGIIKERVNAINGRAAEIRKLKATGLGLRAIARKLRMPPSSVHKALQLAAGRAGSVPGKN